MHLRLENKTRDCRDSAILRSGIHTNSVDSLGQVTLQLFNLRALTSKAVYALMDAELDCDGVVIRIFGLQARHVAGGGTSIHLPTFRDVDGSWRVAVDLPVEVKDALSTAALEFMIEEGVACPRYNDPVGDVAAE